MSPPARQAGQLDAARNPVDVLALVNQLAATWAAQTEITAAATRTAADPSTAARRTAVVNAGAFRKSLGKNHAPRAVHLQPFVSTGRPIGARCWSLRRGLFCPSWGKS
ncbi:hypothetical protein [Streptomyces sp. NBC_01235]|uniref:hypothetical protein n=1 Tax=Streptomyces sp. NBC_01235 TaxID=2903788 RepID=UPI002E11B90C|nr:hypothetical protein OG289_27120 [Streptomyces sp. NBC_01235]